MSNWINGKDLATHWDIEDFELFNCLKKGLQLYTPYGERVVDSDTLEYAREYTLEYFRRYVTSGYCEGSHSAVASAMVEMVDTGRRWSTREKEALAKSLFTLQPLVLVNPPARHISFTLPDNPEKAAIIIRSLMILKFNKKDASEFAKKHRLPPLDDHVVDDHSVSTRQRGGKKEGEAPKVNEVLSSQSSGITEQETWCEDFIRSLRVYFENKDEVKIQERGKEPKTFDYQNLGFNTKRKDSEWARFICVIEGPEHFYKYGPATNTNVYDKNRSKLKEIDIKLVKFLKKEYQLEVPKGSKTYEKAIKEGPGVYRFKFQVGKKVEEAKYQNYAKKDLLGEIHLLNKRMNRIDRNNASSEQLYANTFDSLSAAAMQAHKNQWLDEEEMLEILDENKIWTPTEGSLRPI